MRYKILRLLGYRTYEEIIAELYNKPKDFEIPEKYLKEAGVLEKANISFWMKYPKTGQVYLSKEDYPIHYLTTWSAPYTGGGEAIFPKGEKIKVGLIYGKDLETKILNKPTQVLCGPIDYDRLHVVIVPEKERQSPKYGGYYFVIKTVDLNTKFTLIDEE